VSRESTVELSVDTHSLIEGKAGVEVGIKVLSTIKAEIAAKISRVTGRKIGERLTERQTLTFSVGPKQSVIYEVLWKRQTRSGKLHYGSLDNYISVPYSVAYGLSCEVRTLEQQD
jgi:hypothetical protein